MRRISLFLLLFTVLASAPIQAAGPRDIFLDTPGKNAKVRNIRMLLQEGARPRWAPDGTAFVFDRKNPDGHYDLYWSDLGGSVRPLSEGHPVIPQKSSGNGVFHPSGKYVVFISEEPKHFQDNLKYLADPGVGLYCNFWAVEPATGAARQLTHIRMKRSLLDKTPAVAAVNPHFTPDGKTLLWTERYAKGGNHNWGLWRVKAASFIDGPDGPRLENETVVFTPPRGNYVTFMGFAGFKKLLLAGNLDGQHEYGMDQYTADLQAGTLENLTSTPDFWEEDSTVTPGGKIIFMTNADSRFRYDFNNPSWPSQPIERDYYLMNLDGSRKERLTYFNDPSAPEYMGKRVMTVASDLSPDGKYLAATLGVDFGDKKRDVTLKIALIELELN